MNLVELELAQKTAIPLLAAISDVTSRLLGGIVSLAQAKAELRGILSVASTRLDKADAEFAARDASEDARVKK